MKKKYSFSLFFSLMLFNASAQITFEKILGGDTGEIGQTIIQVSDGGYFIGGATLSIGAGSFENYFVRTDSAGSILWTKSLGGIGMETCEDVKQTFDGGFIAGGITNSFGAGLFDIFLIRMNANGDTLWTKTYGGADDEQFGSISQTIDGGYILTGTTSGQSDDVYLLRLDFAGNVLWEKTYGGNGNDGGAEVVQTTDGGFIIAGASTSFASGIWDAYLIKTTMSGNLLWSKTYGGTDNEYVRDFQQTSDGGYIIGGMTYNINTQADSVYLMRTDGNGDMLWTSIYSVHEKNQMFGFSLSAAGEIIVAGYAFDSSTLPAHACIMDINLNGIPQWAKSFGGNKAEIIYGICSTLDGGFALTGISNSYDSANGKLYIIKTDPNGNTICSDAAENIISGNMPITVMNPPTTEATVTGIVGNPSFIISSGGVDSTLCSSIGVEEISLDLQVHLYPNPATDEVGIFYPGIQPTKIEVFDLLGKKVMDIVPNHSRVEQTINVSDLQPGIYFILHTSENGIGVQKLIKQ